MAIPHRHRHLDSPLDVWAYRLPGDLLAHAERTLANRQRGQLFGLGRVRAEKHHHAAAEREADAGSAQLLVGRRCFTKLRELTVLVVDERIQTGGHAGPEDREASNGLDARAARSGPGAIRPF